MSYDVNNETRSSPIGGVNRILIVGVALASVFLIVVLALGITSSDEGADPLDGTSWRLESLLVDGQQVPVVEGTSPSISFVDGNVQGDGGCNTFSGGYEAGDGTIAIGPLAVTEIFCEEPAGTADQETAYLAQLTRASSFDIDGDRLVLADELGDSLTFVHA